MLRHFPTREALFDALLNETLEELTRKADELSTASSADEALLSWLRHAVAFVERYNGVVDLMAAAVADQASALHASCTMVRAAGARLLNRAQIEGTARADLDGVDLFALIGALGWIGGQRSFTSQADHLFGVIVGAMMFGG